MVEKTSPSGWKSRKEGVACAPFGWLHLILILWLAAKPCNKSREQRNQQLLTLNNNNRPDCSNFATYHASSKLCTHPFFLRLDQIFQLIFFKVLASFPLIYLQIEDRDDCIADMSVLANSMMQKANY